MKMTWENIERCKPRRDIRCFFMWYSKQDGHGCTLSPHADPVNVDFVLVVPRQMTPLKRSYFGRGSKTIGPCRLSTWTKGGTSRWWHDWKGEQVSVNRDECC